MSRSPSTIRVPNPVLSLRRRHSDLFRDRSNVTIAPGRRQTKTNIHKILRPPYDRPTIRRRRPVPVCLNLIYTYTNYSGGNRKPKREKSNVRHKKPIIFEGCTKKKTKKKTDPFHFSVGKISSTVSGRAPSSYLDTTRVQLNERSAEFET